MVLLGSALVATTVNAAGPKAGILPFDVVSVDNAPENMGTTVAKLVQIEMTKGQKLTPSMLTTPEGASLPLPPDQAASVGKAAGVAVVLSGSVTDATNTTTSHSANTGGLIGSSVGASLNRTTAHVELHVDLIEVATAKVLDSFDVEGKATEGGVGLDLSATIGDLNKGGTSADTSPLGKALRDAAKKVNDETAKRTSKLK